MLARYQLSAAVRAPSRPQRSVRTRALLGRERPGRGVVEDEGAQVGQVVRGEPGLGHAGELEQQHVPALGALARVLHAQAGRHGRLRGVQDRQRADALGHPPGDPPGEAAAPVVAHQVHALVAEGVDEPHDVADQLGRGVVLDRRRPVRAAVAAQVRGDRVVPGPGERVELVPPASARARGSRAAAATGSPSASPASVTARRTSPTSTRRTAMPRMLLSEGRSSSARRPPAPRGTGRPRPPARTAVPRCGAPPPARPRRRAARRTPAGWSWRPRRRRRR